MARVAAWTGRVAWMLAAMAGLATASPALGQFARAVNPDRSVTAEDALIRVRELGEAGNTSEALRVLQQVLETESDRMIPVADPTDPGRFEPVREACHRLLLEWPELLTRYRTAEEQNARRLIDQGAHRAVERSRFMTPSGLEAALRVAQEDLESGRFESARMRLQECARHPDANGATAKDSATMALQVAAQIGRSEVVQWAKGLARDAGVEEGTAAWGAREPNPRYGAATTGFDAQPALQPSAIAPRALNSVSPSGDGLAEAIIELEEAQPEKPAISNMPDALLAMQDATASAMFGASVGGMVLINDGYTVACLDAPTLGVRWRTVPPPVAVQGGDPEEEWQQSMINAGRIEDPVTTVSAGSGVVVAPTGSVNGDPGGGSRTLHGMDLATGRVLWSISPASIDPQLAGAEFTGPVLIENDVAIVSLVRSGMMRRESELQLVGIDLFRGTVRWFRRVGSVGVQPWLRQEPRPEAPLLERGVVYRGDDLGVLGAYEASTGRPLWVRQLSTARVDELQFRMSTNGGMLGFQISAPVGDRDSILCYDSIGNKIVRVEGSTGRVLASRDATAFGEIRYMLRVGGQLALVGDRHIAFVAIDRFDQDIVRMASRFGDAGIVGRCVASGDRLLAPVAGGMMLIDPEHPDAAPIAGPAPAPTGESTGARAGDADADEDPAFGQVGGAFKPEIGVARAGNPMVVDLGGGVTTLVVAERSLVSTYLRWEKAQEILSGRVAAEPDDPSPLLTMIELGARAAKYERIPELSDRVLALADKDPLGAASMSARAKLFDLLASMTHRAERSWEDEGGAVAPELLSRILGAMGRSAETPEQLVTHAFAEAWLHEVRHEPARAIESYQGVLADAVLAGVLVDDQERTDPERLGAPVTSVTNAGAEASRRVMGAVKQAGIAAYAGFEEEAVRALDEAGDNVTLLEGVATRYPASISALRALDRACTLAEREGGDTSLALASRGLELARAQAGAAREEAWTFAGSFLRRIVGRLENRPEAALRLVRAIEAERPDLMIGSSTGAGAGSSASSLATELSRRVLARARENAGAPQIGDVLQPLAQPLEGWTLEPALVRTGALSSREAVLLTSVVEGKLALWTRDATGSRLIPAWVREIDGERVTPIIVTPEETLLFVRRGADEANATGGAAIECVETASGRTRWTSPAVAELLDAQDGLQRPAANERFPTPMDGQVRGADVIVAATGTGAQDATLWLVERDGRFAALRVRSGEITAKGISTVTHVYDVDAGASQIAIAGSTTRADVMGMLPRVELIGASGSLVGAVEAGAEGSRGLRLEMGDHARFVRVLGDGDMLIGSAGGLARVATAPGSDGVLAMQWSRDEEAFRSLAGAWVSADDRVLAAIDVQSGVITLDPRTGEATRRRPDTTSRVSLPLDVRSIATDDGDALALTSANGIVVIGRDGVMIGADGITPKGSLAMPALAARHAICVEQYGGSREYGDDSMSRVRIAVLDLPFARVMSTASLGAPGEVVAVEVLDDTVLVSAGESTLVIDAPRAK